MFAAIRAFASRILSRFYAFFFIGTIYYTPSSLSFLIWINIWRNFVNRCLHLWIIKGDQ